jgi:hypothetical protein
VIVPVIVIGTDHHLRVPVVVRTLKSRELRRGLRGADRLAPARTDRGDYVHSCY